jgi:RHS repeat-associated protein
LTVIGSSLGRWSVVAGQQFEYQYDDIGDRQTAASGGDQFGANLRYYQNYSANTLRQYSQRTVPGYVDVQGSATNTATVTVNNQPSYRKDEYYRVELSVDNSVGPLWQRITNVAVLPQGTNGDLVTNITGNVLVPPSTERFFHDADGNLTSDGLWTNSWNAENRLVAMESTANVPAGGKAKESWSHLADGRWYERVIWSWNGSAYVAQATNRLVWDGQVLLAVVDHTNSLVMSFARGLDLSGTMQEAGGVGGVLAINAVTNGAHFAAYNGNGNVSVLLSATDGATTAQYEYSPFGETLRATGPLAKANPIRFSTQLADDVTGNAKYLFRDYLPSPGRWLTRDPIVEKGANPSI